MGTVVEENKVLTHLSPDSYTIGELALSCIAGLNQIENCFGVPVDSPGAGQAYSMCYGQPGALPNTHPVLSITLPVSWSTVPTFTSSRMVPSISASQTESGATTTTTTITVTTSSRASATVVVPGTPTPAPTLTRSTTSSSFFTSATPDTTASNEPQPTPQPAAEAANNSSSLGTSQIVGISVGVSGAILLALAAILFARCMRKRRFQNFDQEGFIAVDGRDSMGTMTGPSGPRERLSMATARLTKIFHISPPIHNPQSRQEPQPSPSKYSFKIDRNTIGLAISRPRSETIPKQSPVVRPPSRLLPPKPTRPPRPNLTLNIPSRRPVASASSQPPPTDRTSTMTNVTGFADLDTEAPEGAQIWRPPPSDPQSATTYYVADKWGNWVLSNRTRRSELAQVAEPAELDTYTPLTKSPAEKREEEAKAMAAAISAAASVPGKRKSKRASRPSQGSLDNNASRRVSSHYLQGSPVAGHSLTRPFGPSGTGSGDSVNRKRMDRGNSKDSRGSATTMDTSSSYGPYDDDSPVEPEVGRLSSLSPVFESPSPTTGRSPVQYPKINGRLDGATIRLVPPPKRPDFTASPPGQPSPTLGVVLPVRGSPSAYPPPLNPRRPWQQQPGAPGPSPLASMSGSGFSPKPKPQPFPTFPGPPLNINRPQSIPGGPRPDKTAQNSPRLDTRQPLRPQHISSFVSPVSAAETTSSTTSSLLAKRLGNEKAAALSLDNHNRKHGGPWRLQERGPNDPGLLSPDMAAAGAGGMSTPRTRLQRLPATPTWQPKLTPTRRGDDLFLNVQ
ncbi:hypothetical protein PG985_007053 [Apiospora marii]|uniref:uncharacterized protein n=1 Tax=Apiospora marii TaxID=335849 RepID=UPI00313198DA